MTTTLASKSLALAAAGFFVIPISAANSTDDKLGPFVVAEQGVLYEGGVYEDAQGSIVEPAYPSTGDAVAKGLNHMTGQMYVFYQLPGRRRHRDEHDNDAKEGWSWQRSGRFPIIMIHGSQQTGANFLGTPDQRPGWAAFYVRHGWPVYVIDQPGRGKSGYFPWVTAGPPPLVGAEDYGPQAANPSPLTVEHMFTAPELTVPLAWPQAALHDQWPGGYGSGVPGEYAFDQFFASQVANMPNGNQALELTTIAVTALIKKIGPAIIITHSMTGPVSWLIPQANPGMIKAVLAVEPTGNSSLNGNTAPGTNCGLTNGGPTFTPNLCLNFTPPISDPADLALKQTPPPAGGIEGEPAANLKDCWLQGSATIHKLPWLNGIPILVQTGQASYHATYDYCTSIFLTQAGVKNTWVYLPTVGITGNGHMEMLEMNNLEIAAYDEHWLSKMLHVHDD
jgi:pimeloyl-ACP methyl ester carboxylesterase